MESPSSVAGIVVLAGLFSTCIDCYQLIRRGAALDKEYRILEMKLNNQELRLSAWGRACGLTDGIIRDECLEDPNLQTQLGAILECIIELFQDESEATTRYGLFQCGELTRTGLINVDGSPANTLANTALGSFFWSKQRQRSMGFLESSAWGVGDREKFTELIQQLKDFNDDLESITRSTGIPRRQRIIVEHEIEEVDDVETLEEIASAAQESEDVVSDAASCRLGTLQDDLSRNFNIRASMDTRRSFHSSRSSLSLDFNPPGPSIWNALSNKVNQNEGKAHPAPQKLKCVAVGDAGCGKTQLLTALAGRLTWGEHIPTVFDNHVMHCTIREDNESRTVELGLFDTAGQEEYQKLWPPTFAQADVFVFCFPADASLERLRASVQDKWLPAIRQGCPDIPFVVAAIHNDWDDADDIPGVLLSIDPKERISFAREIGACSYFDVWPCTRIRIDDILTEIVGAAVAYNEGQKRWRRPKPPRNRRRSLLSRLMAIRE